MVRTFKQNKALYEFSNQLFSHSVALVTIYFHFQWCPNKKVVSVADNCGLVRLLATDTWEKSPTKGKAIFCHEGHVVNSEEEHVGISTHMWHPTIEDLVLSAASDGSLHAWCYKKSKFAT